MKKNLLVLSGLVSILALGSGCAQDSVSAKAMSAKDLANTATTLNAGTSSGTSSGTSASDSHPGSAPASQPAQQPTQQAPHPAPQATVPVPVATPKPQASAPVPTPAAPVASAPAPTPAPHVEPTLDLSTGIGQFLNGLYTGILKRAPDQAGFDYWVARNAMGMGCKQIAMNIVLSNENAVLLRNKALMSGFIFSQSDYISGLYRGLLGREPDQAGFAYWYGGVLNNQFTVATVEDAIIGSAEFQNRCSGLGLAQ